MLTSKPTLGSAWFRNFIVILLALGIFFRFYNLDRKVYWYDETMTSLRISGHTQTELIQAVFDGEVIQVGDLLERYQYPNPAADLDNTLNALAEHPEHSPLYYLSARYWLTYLGGSVSMLRLLSALIGLLALPLTYWLCMALFGEQATAWAAVALMAISPFHVLYAQEAREYSLWTVTILLSSAVLLWAKRRNNVASWSTYGFATALGLYAHPFSALVTVGQGIYVLATGGVRWGKRLIAYLGASLLGLLLFAPWLWVVIQNFSRFLANTDSVNHDRVGFLPLYWGLNLSRVFFDLNQGPSPINPAHYLLALLTLYALYYLYRHAPLSSTIFVFTLIGVTGLALVGPDLILGGRRSSITRYAIPCYLGIQIAIAYLLAHKISTGTFQPKIRQRWRYVATALAVAGILSCAVSSQIPVWWHKSYAKSRYNPAVADIINEAEQPLVISDEIPGRILSLSHLLDPEVRLQLFVEPNVPDIPTSTTRAIFLYRPSENLRRELTQEQNVKLTDVYKSWLWAAQPTGASVSTRP